MKYYLNPSTLSLRPIYGEPDQHPSDKTLLTVNLFKCDVLHSNGQIARVLTRRALVRKRDVFDNYEEASKEQQSRVGNIKQEEEPQWIT